MEAPKAATRGSGGGVTFQEAFEGQTANDPDMAKKIDGIDAVLGTLSHSHFNCVLRNIRSGSPRCTCGSPGVTCACDNALKAFLTAEGNYDCDALKRFDESWGELVDHGMPWEILSAQMDIEEPEAALTISIALNKKNEAAMETGHTEIMKTLVSLCKPSPGAGALQSTVVEFEPIRNKMLDLYGSSVDHPDFFKAF